MSATDGTDAGTPADGATGADELTDHAYFQAIEAVFIGLRGAPLLLSPKDWQTARDWHRRGIPLDLVTRTLQEVFERRRERGDEDKISSLRYCHRAVKAAWKELRELTAVTGAPGAAGEGAGASFDPAARLEALARALPEDLPGRESLVERLVALAGVGAAGMGDGAGEGEGAAPADPRAIEEALTELDREVLEGLVEALPEARRRALEAEAEESVRALADRLPRGEVERARRRVFEQKVRRIHGLPTLSLFAPEAEVEG